MKLFILAVMALVFLSLVPYLLHGMVQEAVDAKTLFEKKCSACHSIDRPKSMKKTNAEWTRTIMRMKEKTGNITTDETRIIIDYLTKTYGK